MKYKKTNLLQNSSHNSEIYNLIYKYLINENKEHNNHYSGNCSIETRFFLDVVIDNYYIGDKVNDVDQRYLEKSGKWYGSSRHAYNISWIKNLFKLAKSSPKLTKNISSEFSKDEFKSFLIIYMTEVIKNNEFNKGSKVLVEWHEFLNSIDYNNNLSQENEVLAIPVDNENLNSLNLYQNISQEDRKELDKIQNSSIDNQTKTYLYKARIGQGKYREDLLSLHNNTCMISNIEAPELLIASHIVPWVKSNNVEKLDKYNGLLLSSSIDKLFDQYLISFDNNGFMVVSEKFKKTHSDYKDIMSTIGIYESLIEQKENLKFSIETKEYMKRHFKELKK